MFKSQSVALLKEGDRFKFVGDLPRKVDGGGTEAKGGDVLEVTRSAQVNMAAGSCFFRYRPANDPAGYSQSWNGNTDALVQLEVEGAEPIVEAMAIETLATEAPRKRRTTVKLVKQTVVEPLKKKSAASGKSAAKKAAAKTESVKPAKVVKPSKRLVLRSSPTPAAGAKSSAAAHSTSRAKRPSLTPQLSKPAQKKTRRA